MVLVGVLAFLVLLLGVLVEFTYRARVQLDIAHHRLEAVRLRQAADSAVDIAKALLAHAVDTDAPVVKELFETGGRYFFGDIRLDVRFEPESGKFNLNRLVDRRGSLRLRDVRLLLRLSELLGENYESEVLTYDMIVSILEWISPEESRDLIIAAVPGEPAGSRYYLQKTPPYECKHNYLNAVSELLLVKGITEEVLYGRPGREGEASVPGLARLVTVYGNSRSMISMLAREGIDVGDILNIEPETHESYITVVVRARLGDAERRVRAVVGKEGPRVVEFCREYR